MDIYGVFLIDKTARIELFDREYFYNHWTSEGVMHWFNKAPRDSFRWKVSVQWRKARFVLRKLRRVLTDREIFVLAVTHIPILLLAAITIRYVRLRYGKMPRQFEPHGKHLATVVVSLGFQQLTEEAYWIARALSRWWGVRIVMMVTPTNGNVRSAARIAELQLQPVYEAIVADYVADIPVIGLAFSKGGRDITVLAERLIEEYGIVLDSIFTISTPWRGSGLSVLSKHMTAVSMSLKHSTAVRWRDRVLQLHSEWGVHMRFFCATWGDRVVLRSNARIVPPDEDAGITLEELRTRWYYAQPLWLQLGHTAFYNPLVWYQMGVEIHRLLRQLKNGGGAETLRNTRRQLAFERCERDD